jgi:hypothetical protein
MLLVRRREASSLSLVITGERYGTRKGAERRAPVRPSTANPPHIQLTRSSPIYGMAEKSLVLWADGPRVHSEAESKEIHAAGVDYNLTLCPLQHIYHGHINNSMQESTLSFGCRLCRPKKLRQISQRRVQTFEVSLNTYYLSAGKTAITIAN